MKMLRMRSYDDYDEEMLGAGDHYISVDLNEVLVFVRPGKSLPLTKPARHVDELDFDDLTIIS